MSTTIEEDLETRLRKYMESMIISIEETMRDELKRALREPENAQKEQKLQRARECTKEGQGAKEGSTRTSKNSTRI
ncbi:hypothetical protein CVS40_9882 [Lucilia cuprina]|nr:hypothetical protein CVS40_9882 [Lucilia cuprina]